MIRPIIRGVIRPTVDSGVGGLKRPCRTGVLAYYDWSLTAGDLRDRSGNGLDATVVSGTSLADLVITLPADADLITADTDDVFFDALDVPRNVTLSAVVDESSGGNIRINDDGLILLSAAQTEACLIKTNRYIGAGFPYTLPFEVS